MWPYGNATIDRFVIVGTSRITNDLDQLLRQHQLSMQIGVWTDEALEGLIKSSPKAMARLGLDFTPAAPTLGVEGFPSYPQESVSFDVTHQLNPPVAFDYLRVGGKVVKAFSSHVLLGEAKCQTFPSEPLERRKYLNTLEDAAGRQLKEKYSAVLRNRGAVLKELGLDEKLSADRVRFVPFILTNHALGVGWQIEDTPVIDLKMLRQYLRDGTWHPLTERSEGRTVTVGRQRLYTDEEDASRSLGELMMNPPQTEFYRRHLRAARVPYGHLRSGGKRLKRVEYEVRLPVST